MPKIIIEIELAKLKIKFGVHIIKITPACSSCLSTKKPANVRGLLPLLFPIRLKWQMHPDRDLIWAQEQRLALGEKRFAQEIGCNFLQPGYNIPHFHVFYMGQYVCIFLINSDNWFEALHYLLEAASFPTNSTTYGR